MKMVGAAFLVTAIFVSASCDSAAQKSSIEQSARLLNEQSISSLGVSVPALRFLSEAGPGSYFLKDGLTRDGSWKHLQTLEKAGYVTVRVFPAAEGEFAEILLTSKGLAVKNTLHGP